MGKGIARQYSQAHITICGSCFHKDVCGNKDYLTENQCCNFVDSDNLTPAEIESLKDEWNMHGGAEGIQALYREIEALKSKLQKVERERDAAVKLLYSMPIANKRVEEIRHDILKILEAQHE